MKLPSIIFVVVLSFGTLVLSARAQTSTPSAISAPPNSSAPAASFTASPPPAPTTVTGDIHDIRGPISIPYPWLWAMYGAAALALAGAFYGLWRYFRRHTLTPKQPFEIALDRLEAARQWMAPDTAREYAFAVSEIIRNYIEQRFQEKAAHRTTEEFLSDLLQQTGTPLATHHDRLADFLEHCDLAKFARWQLGLSEMEAMHQSARDFILDTRPSVESAKPVISNLPTAEAGDSNQPDLVEAK
jgi:hypothetical protein